MKLLCYGDSNTYGYDPRSFLADRYPKECRWTTLLEADGHTVLNYGMNGREIPHRIVEIDSAAQLFICEQPDLLLLMLGSNDLLMNPIYTAERVADRMAGFLRAIQLAVPRQQILLLPPVPMRPGTWVQEDRLLRESYRLGALYAALAQKHAVAFSDTADWNVSLTFDGVHFSEQGHQAFFTGLKRWLDTQTYP